MSKPKEVIKNSLEYYDRNNNKYKDLLSKAKYYSLEFFEGDMEKQKISLYDKNREKILESSYEMIGLYSHISGTWTWAWSIPTLPKNEVFLSRKILNYGLDLIPDKNSIFLKTELVTSRFRINDKIQLDIHVSLASYLAKVPFIFKLYVLPTYHEFAEEGIFPVMTEDQIVKEEKKNYQIYYLFLLNN